MARKRNEARSIISAEGSAAAAPLNRRRSTHVKPGSKTVTPNTPETLEEHTTAVESAVSSAASAPSYEPISEREEIAKLAYSFYLERGGQAGSAEEDWIRAEQEFQRRREASAS